MFSTDPIDLNGSATVRFVVASEDFDAFLSADDIDTDGTLAANSDAKIASQKATKTYADTKLSKSGGTLTGDLTLNRRSLLEPARGDQAVCRRYRRQPRQARHGARGDDGQHHDLYGLNAGDSVDGVTLANGDRVLVRARRRGRRMASISPAPRPPVPPTLTPSMSIPAP